MKTFEFKADYVAKCLPNLLLKLFSDFRGKLKSN